MDELDKKIIEAYDKVITPKIDEGIKDFIDDSKKSDAVFKDLEIATNDMIMKVIIPRMQKIEKDIKKKHGVGEKATMGVNNLGTAYIHDVFRQLIGQNILSVSSGLKKITRKNK